MRRLLFCAALLLGGCSMLKEQAPIGNSFSPPAGWKELPMPFKVSVNPVIGIWSSPSSTKDNPQMVILMRLPIRGERPLSDSFMTTGQMKDATVISRKKIVLCGGTPGIELVARTQPSATEKNPSILQLVGGSTKAETLMVLYRRDEKTQSDPNAVSAVERLCPRTQSAPQASG